MAQSKARPAPHPILSTVDDIAHLLTANAERPCQCTEAGQALKLITALSEAVAEAEVQRRAEASHLQTELTDLRRRLTWRTAALEILLVGVAAIAAVMWTTQWWPR